MMDRMTLGSVPGEEKCAELGTPNYEETALGECHIYRRQLLRMYEEEHHDELPYGCTVNIQPHVHDYGTYYEVSVRYNPVIPEAVEAAHWFDANKPSHWDMTARLELQERFPGWKAA